MSQPISLTDSEEHFHQITHQGKTIAVGDPVIVHHAGERQAVTVSSIVKQSNHFWVGYHNNQHFCPWPLVRLK